VKRRKLSFFSLYTYRLNLTWHDRVAISRNVQLSNDLFSICSISNVALLTEVRVRIFLNLNRVSCPMKLWRGTVCAWQ